MRHRFGQALLLGADTHVRVTNVYTADVPYRVRWEFTGTLTGPPTLYTGFEVLGRTVVGLASWDADGVEIDYNANIADGTPGRVRPAQIVAPIASGLPFSAYVSLVGDWVPQP